MEPEAHNYQSVLSMLMTAVFGRGWFYYLTMGSVLLALSLSANTAFADFPRLARAIRCMIICRTCLLCAGGGCCIRMASMR